MLDRFVFWIHKLTQQTGLNFYIAKKLQQFRKSFVHGMLRYYFLI